MFEHGVDLLEIKRIHAAVEKHGERFVARILSPEEQAYFSSKLHGASDARKIEWLAGRYAAKEAILKALGTGLAGKHQLARHNGFTQRFRGTCGSSPKSSTRTLRCFGRKSHPPLHFP